MTDDKKDLALQQTTPVGRTIYLGDRTQATKLINTIFQSLKGIFPAWNSSLGDPDIEAITRKEWLLGLMENGINTDTQIKAGLRQCRQHNSPFLPSIGMFVTWCKQGSGVAATLPTQTEARAAFLQEISRHKDFRTWNKHHPIVYWIFDHMGDLPLTAPMQDVVRLFDKIWPDAVKRVMEGVDLPTYTPPERQIEQTKPEPCDPEVARAGLDRVLSVFNET